MMGNILKSASSTHQAKRKLAQNNSSIWIVILSTRLTKMYLLMHYGYIEDSFIVKYSLLNPVFRNRLSGLALHPILSKIFFSNKKKLLALLTSDPLASVSKIFTGEHPLTKVAVSLLLNKKRCSDIELIDHSNKIELLTVSNIKLNDKLSQSIIFFDGKHSFCIHIRKYTDKYHLIVIDSTPSETTFKVIEEISSMYREDGVHVYANRSKLQEDFYSCSVFSLEAATFFVTYGEQYIRYLSSCSIEQSDDIYFLSPCNFPREILRLCQFVERRGSIFTSCLSFFAETHKNPIAIMERYRLFSELDHFISQNDTGDGLGLPNVRRSAT